ncbi:hypothetical protein BGZ83_000650 [Gryganskiella cystojenkinii]|nr:hypothetical protein BGZ83_000650 [Gryganskiella cystojenkinii]
MRSTFTSSMLALIAAVFAVLCMTTSTASAQCQGCIDDVVHAVPSCEKVDNSVHKVHFSDYSKTDQQCICNLGHNPIILLKCKAFCPDMDFDYDIELYNATYSMYCNNTVMANGGPVGGKNAAVGTFSSTTLVFSGLVAVAISVALAIAT